MTPPGRRPWWYVAFAVLYFACAKLGPHLAAGLGPIQPTYWPAVGVYLAFAACTPASGFPILAACTLGSLLLTGMAGANQTLVGPFVPWLGNTLAVFLGGMLLRQRQILPRDAWTYRRIVTILLGSALLTPLVSSTTIAGVLWLQGHDSPVLEIWRRYFQADSLGILTVTPFTLGALEQTRWPGNNKQRWQLASGALYLGLLASMTLAIFGPTGSLSMLHHAFLLYPGLCWIAMQGRRGLTGAANLVTAIVVVFQTAHGQGAFSATHDGTVAGMQLFIAVNALVTFLLTEVVAERKRIMAQLTAENQARRNAEERLELAVEASGLGVFEHVSVTEANMTPQLRKILGFGPGDEVTLDQINARVVADDQRRIEEHMAQIVAGTLVSWSDEIRIQPPGQPQRWVSFHVKGSSHPTLGGQRRIAGTLKDITVDVQARDALRHANAAAAAASQTKSRFLANMSHEIRTPLGAIIGFADLLLDDRSTDAERREFAQVIRRNGLHLNDLINQVLDLSKVEAGRLETVRRPVSIREAVDDVLTSLRLTARDKGLAFGATTAADVPELVHTDPMRLRQILLNAIGNAIKFTDRGEVRIHVGTAVAAGRIQVVCDIADTGIGMSVEEQSHLFQPFSQANGEVARKYGGTGLGLTLSRHLAAMLGGAFELLHSEQGIGSTFRLTLSTDTEAPPQKSRQGAEVWKAAPDAAPRGPLAGICVLLADDFADGRILVRRYLERAGAAVDIAENGREAVEKATAKHYDAILMDLQMPEVDGFEATAMLRSRAYQGPIFALTAHTQAEEVASVLVSGFNGHVGKPVDQKALIARLRALTPPVDGPAFR